MASNVRNFEIQREILLKQYGEQARKHIEKISKHELFVIKEVCDLFRLELELIFVNRRYTQLFLPRNMAIKRLHELHLGNYSYYGKLMYLQSVDHTTIIRSLQTFRSEYDTNEFYKLRYLELCERTSNASLMKKATTQVEKTECVVPLSEFIQAKLPQHCKGLKKIEIIIENSDGEKTNVILM